MLSSLSVRPDTTMTKIEVTRAFYLAGKLKEIGAVLAVERHLALELIHHNKAVAVPPEAAAAEAAAAEAAKTQSRASRKKDSP